MWKLVCSLVLLNFLPFQIPEQSSHNGRGIVHIKRGGKAMAPLEVMQSSHSNNEGEKKIQQVNSN